MATILRRKMVGKVSIEGIAEHCNSDITTVRNDADLEPDAIWFRWGCTSTVPYTEKVINSSVAIHRVADKSAFRMILNESGICPRSWFRWQDVGATDFPIIVRTRVHAQARGLWYCKNEDEMMSVITEAGAGYYINEYIPKIEEFRVFCMQGRVVWMARKNVEDKTQIAWNHSEGSVFENVRWDSWNGEVARVALEAMDLSKLHFGGVDVILDADYHAYVLEINSAPSLPYPYRQKCVAKAFDWLLDTNNYRIKAFDHRPTEGWRGIIHPALTEEARYESFV